MSHLARLPHGSGKKASDVIAFGNVNYSENFAEGDFRETMNVSCAEYPSVIPRTGRTTVSQESGATAAYYFDGFGKVVGNKFYWDDYTEDSWVVSPGEKQFAKVGNILCIYPDKAYFVLPDADHPHGQFTAGVNSSYTIPHMLPMSISGNTLYFPYSADTPQDAYTRVDNGEYIEGRGAVKLNSFMYVSENYDGAEILQMTFASEGVIDSIVSRRYRYYPRYDPQYPNSSSQTWYYLLGFNPNTDKKTAHYWQNEDGTYIDRNFYVIKYGIWDENYEHEDGTRGGYVYTGETKGWEYANPDNNPYDTNINSYYDNKTLDKFLVGDIIGYDEETGEYLIVESLDRIGYEMESVNVLSADKGKYGEHFYVKVSTGKYTKSTLESPYNVNDSLGNITPHTNVTLSIGGTSFDTTYEAKGISEGRQFIRFGNGLTPFVQRIYNESYYENVMSKTGEITIFIKDDSRDFDFVVSSGNRLWGVSGNEIYASAFGDPTDFYTSDSISADTWKSEVGSDGEWTGIVEYSGNVYCFKEDIVHVVMGNLPENYKVYTYNFAGIKKGFSKSAVVINEILYYYGVEGVYRFRGNAPELISPNFGLREFAKGIAGTDGMRYYICLTDADATELMCFDVGKRIWIREDDLNVIAFTRDDKLYALATDGRFIAFGDTSARGYDNGTAFEWSVLTVPFREKSFEVKYNYQILVRILLYENAELSVSVRYDGGTEKEIYHKEETAEHNVYVVPIIPQRCDEMQIRIYGKGNFILRGIEKHWTGGTAYAKS